MWRSTNPAGRDRAAPRGAGARLAARHDPWHYRRPAPGPARMKQQERQAEEQRFTTTLAGLAVALFLTVIGLYLIQKLAALSKLEDCMMQGRLNCERIELTRFSGGQDMGQVPGMGRFP